MQVIFDVDFDKRVTSIADGLMKDILQLSPPMRANMFLGIKAIVDAMFEMAIDDVQLQTEGMDDASTAH